MRESVLIREERPADHAAVRDLVRAAFGADGESVAALVADLRTIPGTLSLVAEVAEVAEVEGAIAGHVMYTASLLDAPARLLPVPLLSPLAVAPAHQRTGIGSALVRAGLDAMAGRGAPLVFLEGDPRYYSRLGFVSGGPLGFRKPSLRIPDAAFQVYTLAAYEDWMTGTLVYHRAFWDHDAVGLREEKASIPDTFGGSSATS